LLAYKDKLEKTEKNAGVQFEHTSAENNNPNKQFHFLIQQHIIVPLHIPDPLSITRAAISSSSAMMLSM